MHVFYINYCFISTVYFRNLKVRYVHNMFLYYMNTDDLFAHQL